MSKQARRLTRPPSTGMSPAEVASMLLRESMALMLCGSVVRHRTPPHAVGGRPRPPLRLRRHYLHPLIWFIGKSDLPCKDAMGPPGRICAGRGDSRPGASRGRGSALCFTARFHLPMAAVGDSSSLRSWAIQGRSRASTTSTTRSPPPLRQTPLLTLTTPQSPVRSQQPNLPTAWSRGHGYRAVDAEQLLARLELSSCKR